MTPEVVTAPAAGTVTPARPDPAHPVAPSDPRLDAWRSFVHAHARLTRRLDEELQAAHRLSLAEYD